MHTPPFLILDEPTVGLDPVLRDAIWRYFVVLSREQSTTIVVTTHFIEEIADAALDVFRATSSGSMKWLDAAHGM
ncbi:hypothetical protein HPB51_010948 [Rhipicephalus microplus]|uniref:ATPase AAA-type core domain-containing protein n=1 Tax=Rhipicephalus microplus TaxID=6941 RepID=A0A9J6D4N0_RHIMP|nr:hypothetical protein HPB51_010948 [Rhipicephalus microplus]